MPLRVASGRNIFLRTASKTSQKVRRGADCRSREYVTSAFFPVMLRWPKTCRASSPTPYFASQDKGVALTPCPVKPSGKDPAHVSTSLEAHFLTSSVLIGRPVKSPAGLGARKRGPAQVPKAGQCQRKLERKPCPSLHHSNQKPEPPV